MNFKQLAIAFLMIAPVVLLVSLVVSYLYDTLVHGNGVVEWESSIRLAVILGIVLPVARQLDKKKTL